ncbi:hypothetical protein ACGFZK_15610 [Streptomyces sp. NPDC048257]|uniref:hypothetical protein n=1 Tax=Streptomyces sp. NPDC048257 TaxID=3365526 RepID=UPI00371B360C
MASTTPSPSTAHRFQVDLRGWVDLLSHHLYSSPRAGARAAPASASPRSCSVQALIAGPGRCPRTMCPTASCRPRSACSRS